MFAFFLVAGISAANAQCHATAGTAGKSCCASKAASAAAKDPTIEKRQAENGTMSYVRKEADQQGNVRFVSVSFDEAQNAFVNVAPPATTVSETEKAGMVKKSASCAAGGTKACCAGGAKSGKSCAAASAGKVEQK